MHAVARPLELRLLLPLVVLVPLGFAVTHIAQTGTLDPGPMGVAVAYVGLNKPYLFFGSRLQNTVYVVPRIGELESQYYRWGGTLEFPFDSDDYTRWRRRLNRLGVGFVVVHRSPWENPERSWMAGRPRAFRLEFFDLATEIWRVLPEAERATPGAKPGGKRRGAADPSEPSPAAAGAAPRPG